MGVLQIVAGPPKAKSPNSLVGLDLLLDQPFNSDRSGIRFKARSALAYKIAADRKSD
jgi:hypothetical protein